MQKDEIIIKIVGYLLGLVGSLLLFGGGIIAYIFKRHVSENDRVNKENREDHKEIYRRIRDIENKKK